MSNNVLFQPDYQADPIWDAATGAMVYLESLPIEVDLRSAIRSWAARWEQLAGQQEELAYSEMDAEHAGSGILPGSAAPGPGQTWEMNEQEGRALCQQLRNELGEGWRVGWVTFTDGQRHVQWEPDGPVTLFLPGPGPLA